MKHEIENYLYSKDAKRYGTCKVCGTKVYWTHQKVASHLRSVNCTKSKLTTILPNEQTHSRTEFPPTAFSRRTDFETEDKGITLVKARDYIELLQQFQYLPLFDKKQYLRKRAPESFIQILREILRNVRSEIVPCDESLMKKCNKGYCYDRIDQKTVTNQEARHHLCQFRTLGPLIEVLPFVLKYLQSVLK